MSIKTLPIVEKWDCHSCGYCCRGTVIPLDEDDLRKIREQEWENVPEFRGIKTTTRLGLIGNQRVLAKKADGSCVFFTDDCRCRIHEKFGAEAKPAICQMFPLQVVTLDRQTLITLRRSCPSAAADDGRELKEHLKPLKKSKLLNTNIQILHQN